MIWERNCPKAISQILSETSINASLISRVIVAAQQAFTCLRENLTYREAKRSIRVYLVLRFWCFKNFQMPPPKKYDNKILHVGPVEVFWHFRQNFPNFTRFFTQILGKKVSLSDVIKISYVVSTYRTWWSFLTLSAKFPQFWGKKCP